jgi:hypothetical protein
MRVLKMLYPNQVHNLKALSKKNLHFADMPNNIQNQVASHLAQERIAAVINSHWHNDKNEPYKVIFGRYTKMVQLLLYRALELTTGNMKLIIAQQGGWETYGKEFLAEVGKATDLFSKRNKKVFRNVGYQLKSAQSVCGLQLADFYAGAVRKMFLDMLNGMDAHLSNPYKQVRHQIRLEEFIDLE